MDTIDSFIEKFSNAVDFQAPIIFTPSMVLEQMPEWDSLAALGVIVMFDMEYQKTITGDNLRNCKTIYDLYQLIG